MLRLHPYLTPRIISRTAALALTIGLLSQSAYAKPDAHTSSLMLAGPEAVGLDAEDVQSLRAGIQAAVDAGKFPGAVLMIANKDKVGVLETIGTQGPEDSTPMNAETLFRIYSMSKPIVSVATLMLVEQGKIALQDPVSKYIPEFAQLSVMAADGSTSPAMNTMTVEHLLTHESGLIYGVFDPDSELGKMYIESGSSSYAHTALEMSKKLAALPLRFEPGTKWHYSRSTDVLGAVIEVAAGKTLDVLLDDMIFTPLGMDDTSFYIDQSNASRLAEAHYGELTTPLKKEAMFSGGGGLNSTTEDYARFGFMLMNGGQYMGTRLIKEETLALMRQPRIGDTVSREHFFYRDFGDFGLGFGLLPNDMGQPDSPKTFGWDGAAGTNFWVDPANEFFVVYMIQARDVPNGNGFSARTSIYQELKD
ncbi:MAG: serine hydrolase domain-containing protein [Gammaproteobacteria bacterium]